MVEGFTPRLKAVLREHECVFVRYGRGDHEIWQSPNADRPFVVDGRILSRHTANAVLKQAGLKVRF